MMFEVTFSAIRKALAEVQLPECELVVGIANGGIVPASLVAYKIGSDLSIVRFNYRNHANIPQHPEPVLLSPVKLSANINSILLVDDVSISGETLKAAKRLFQGCQVKTMVLRGRADYVLFPELRDCVRWPWKYILPG